MGKRMKNNELAQRVEELAEQDGRYRKEAFFFVFEALQYTVESVERTGKTRHVTGKELLQGVSEYGREQFGPMTKTVFEHWGLSETRDFGEIVFLLVDAGLMGKTDEDSIDDFIDIYDFEVEFDWHRSIGQKFRDDE